MTELKKILESRIKIRFHDCDPFNHLNNSKYIDYIVTARGDQLLENYGLDIYSMAQQEGIGWVTAHTQIAYMHPALPAEDVLIQTQLIEISKKSLMVEALMWNASQSIVKAVMWTRLVHFDLVSKKSKEHSQELMQLFEKIVNPLPAYTPFESRVQLFKKLK